MDKRLEATHQERGRGIGFAESVRKGELRSDGRMWRQADLFDAPVYYLAFHGKPGKVISLTGDHRRRAVIGYSTRVDWMASLLADLLFLHRFYRDASPWRNLRRIFASVQRDYPRARALGHVLVTRD